MTSFDAGQIRDLDDRFRHASPEAVLSWAIATFRSRLAVLSSFGVTSGALLRMLAQIDASVPVVFLQTHRHFPQTLKLREVLTRSYGLTVEEWSCAGDRPEWEDRHAALHARPDLDGVAVPEAAQGASLRTGADLCCWFNKVEPLARALADRDAYVTSLRRDGGTELRARTRVVELLQPRGRSRPLVKINPLAHWDRGRLWDYIRTHAVPIHELHGQGYTSIGCEPCTRAVRAGEDERAGRWCGIDKAECGLHAAATTPDDAPPRLVGRPSLAD